MNGRILVVDDQLYVRKLLEVLLRREGYDVVLAENGSEAVKNALESNPDIILLDVMMPIMNGFEAAKHIRDFPQFSRTPIIFLTAKDEISDKKTAFDLGGDDYIVKPFDNEELIARVERRMKLVQQADKDQQMARVETLSQLMVTIAHYINNALAVIQGQAQLTPPDDPERVEAFMKTLKKQTTKILLVVESIEEMAQQSDVSLSDYAGMKKMFDISERLDFKIKELQRRYPSQHDVH